MPLTAALLSPTPVLSKHIARVLCCAGVTPSVVDDVGALEKIIEGGIDLVCLGGDSLDPVVPSLKKRPRTLALVWSDDKASRLVAAAPALPQLNNVFGLRYPAGPPRSWELLRVVRRLTGARARPEGYLDWGATIHRLAPTSTAMLDQAVTEVEGFASRVNNQRFGSSMAEVTHELLMNAMYDAPVDAAGEPLFAFRRSEAIELGAEQRPELTYGCDGARFMISVADPFGGLRREHVFGGLARSLASATLDRSHGGAGIGLAVVFRATTLLFFDVVRGQRTEATAVLELDVPQRELRTLPRSVHFFQQEPS